MYQPYIIALVAGLALAVTAGVYLILYKISGNWNKWRLRGSPHAIGLMKRVDKHLKLRKIKLRASVYLAIIVFAISAGITAGAILNNPLAAILIVVIGFVIPEQIFLYLILRKQLIMFDQLVEACPVFASELERVKVAPALNNTGSSIPDPVGKIFRQAYRDLVATNDLAKTFGRMMGELDFKYGQEFTIRVLDCYNNSSVAPLIRDLGIEMEQKRKKLHEKISQLFQDRMLTLVIMGLFIPAYAIASHLAPTTWEFLTQTVTGKLLLCFYLLSIVIGPIVDYRIIKNMEV